MGDAHGIETARDLTREALLQFLDFIAAAGLSVSRRNRYITAITAGMRWAAEEWPALGLALPGVKKGREPVYDDAHLTPEEWARVRPHLTGEWAVFFLLLWETGLRLGEAQHLHAADVVGEAVRVVSRPTYRLKTLGSARTVPLPAALRGLVPTGAWAPYLWSPHARQEFTPLYQWKKATTAANVSGKSIHSLRHGFGVRLARAGIDARLIGQLLSHSNLTTTQRYMA